MKSFHSIGLLIAGVCVFITSVCSAGVCTKPVQAVESESTAVYVAPPPSAIKLLDEQHLAIQTADYQLRDRQRNKIVPVHATFPVAAGHYPVIIFSHGLFGSKDGYVYLAQYWAQHGYVCLQPAHEDSVQWNQQRGKHVRVLKTLFELPHDKEAGINRAQDISFVISALSDGKSMPALQAISDTTKIGVSGHSDGAFTSVLIAGAEIPHQSRAPHTASVRDERVKAMIAFSPQGVRRRSNDFGFDSDESFKAISMPSMFVSGDRDITGWQTLRTRSDAFRGCQPGSKYFVSIKGASHMTFAGIDASVPEKTYKALDKMLGAGYGNMAEHQKLMMEATTLFWNAYLKGDTQAAKVLNSGAMIAYLGAKGTFEHR